MKRYLSCAVALMMALIACTGCYSYRDTNRVLFMTMGICDEKNGQLQFFCEAFKAYRGEGDKAGKEKRVAYFGKGVNLSEAARDVRVAVNYPVDYSGNKSFVFTQRLAENGLETTFDLLGRDQKPSMRTYLFIFNGDASDLASVTMEDEEFMGFYLYEMMNSHKYTLGILPNQYYQFVKNLRTGSGINLLPMLETETIEQEAAVLPNEKPPEEQQGKQQEQGSGKEQEEGGKQSSGEQRQQDSASPFLQSSAQLERPYVAVNGAAILQKGKMVGVLNGDELETYNLMTSKVKSGIISTPNPGYEGALASFSVLGNKYKSKASMAGKRIKLDFTTTVRVVLIDVGPSFPGDRTSAQQLEKELEEVLAARALALFERMQKENIDIFDVKRKLELAHTPIQSDDFLQQVDFSINVDVIIDGLGILKASYY